MMKPNPTEPAARPRFLLASGSPRRRELLARMGLTDFAVAAPDVEERIDMSLPPGALVEGLSLQKAYAVACPDETIVIAADTVVVLNGQVLGKPRDEADAARMLRIIAGNTHLVYTGVTVLRGEKILTRHAVTAVTFRALTDAQIVHYISTGEPMDKAGAYGIQGVGASLVTRLEGDYYNVMGLPAALLADMLSDFGVDLLAVAVERSAH